MLDGTPTALVARVSVGSYPLALGGVVLLKGLRPRPLAAALPAGQVGALGFCGGMLDATGGGDWGAIVTATLPVRGNVPDRQLMVIVGVVVSLLALRGRQAAQRALAGGG